MKFWFFFFLIGCVITGGYSQEKDFGTWLTLSLEKKLNYRFDLSIDQEIRFCNNATRLDKIYTNAGIKMAFFQFFSAGFYYRFITEYIIKNQYFNSHRIYADLSGRYKINRFSFGIRSRFQPGDIETALSDLTSNNQLINRNKLSVKYNIRKSPVTPYLSMEIFLLLNRFKPSYINKTRLTAGGEYKISKKHSVDLYLLIQNEYYRKNPLTLFVFGTQYTCSL